MSNPIIRKYVKLPYRKMILKDLAIKQTDNTRAYTSMVKLRKEIRINYHIGLNQKRHSMFFKKMITNLITESILERRKNSYRIKKEILNKILTQKKKTNKITKVNLSKSLILVKKTPYIFYKKQKVNKISKAKLFISNLPLKIATSSFLNESYLKRYAAIWQFYDNNNFNASIKKSDGWYDYESEASDIVEDEWQRYIVNRGMNDVRSVKSGEWEYMVDFVNWKQTNIIHMNHKIRAIRRLDENHDAIYNPYL